VNRHLLTCVSSSAGVPIVAKMDIFVMTGFWKPQIGLLSRKNPIYGEVGIVIPHCRAIHTFFMWEPVDVVFVTQERVVKVLPGVKPFHVVLGPFSVFHGFSSLVLEWSSNRRQHPLPKMGDQIVVS
jgi:uncharacterized membrane protein (UPF0127 family)